MSLKEQLKDLSREVLEAKFLRLHSMATNLQNQLEDKEETIELNDNDIKLLFIKLKKLNIEQSTKKQIRQVILLFEKTQDNNLHTYINKILN